MRIPLISHAAPSDAPPHDAAPEHPQLAEANRLLRAIPREEYDRLLPHLEPVTLEQHHRFYQRGEEVGAVWFIEQGAASWIVDMDNGDQVEAGTVGNEGLEGLFLFLGTDRAPARSDMQVPGHGKRMERERFRELVAQCPTLHRLLLRYASAFIAMTAQSAACNRLHSLEQRCARWLLMSHDRARGGAEFHLTQDYLATMLGVRRAGVSEAASTLQRSGIITYRRGRVTVLDREGLERVACECYGCIRAEIERIFG